MLKRCVLIAIICFTTIAACGRPAATPPPIAHAPTLAPTAAPTAVATAIPRPTDTPAPTATTPPTATATSVPPTAAPTATPSPSPTPAPAAVVTGDSINVRGGPGTVYPIVGQAKKGVALPVVSRTQDGAWLEVTLTDGKQGWVSAKLVALNVSIDALPVAKAIPPTPKAPPTAIAPTALSAGDILKNVRLMSDGDERGPARCTFSAGVTTIWLGYELVSAKLQDSDQATLNLTNAAGETVLSFWIVGPNRRVNAAIIGFGATGTKYIAVSMRFDDGHAFPNGAYRAELILNGKVTGVILWTVG